LILLESAIISQIRLSFFAPAVGVNEDPITGPAHYCLPPSWADSWEKTEMIAC